MATFQIQLALSSQYHLQTDGQTEKVNHVIGTYLRAFSQYKPDKWDELLLLGELAYNASVQSAMAKTPFELDLGYTQGTVRCGCSG